MSDLKNRFPGETLFPLHPRGGRFKKNAPLANRQRNAENRVKTFPRPNHRAYEMRGVFLSGNDELVKFFTNCACVGFDPKNKVAVLTHI